jgi:hypothetical protein
MVQISLDDTNLIYSNDEQHLLDHLNKLYAGYCYKKALVLKVIEIVNKSPIIIDSTRNSGKCRIDIEFSAQCVIYDKYEVITDAEIVEIMDNGQIFLKNDYCAIGLAPNAKLQQFRVGATVPVRVVVSRYVPNSKVVAIQAIPFVPIIIKMDAVPVQLSQRDYKQVESLFDDIESEIQEIKKLDKKKIDKIKETLSPVKTSIKKITNTKLIKELFTDNEEYWITRHDWMDPLEPSCIIERVERRATQQDNSSGNLQNSINNIKVFLNMIYKNAIMIRSLAELYKFDDSDAYIWKIYTDERIKM